MGPTAKYSLSEEACKALSIGDVDALLEFHKIAFGGWKMEGEDGGEDEGDEDSDGGEDEGDEDSDGGEDEGDEAKSKAAREEAERRKATARQLKKDNEELLKKLKKFEDADKSDLDKITVERDELLATVKTMTGTNQKLALQVAFLQDNEHTWHDPKTALRLIDMDGVEIDEDGEVTGLDKAIEKLAKSSPFLLKKSDSDDDEDKPERRASGQPPTRRSSKLRSHLESKYRLG